MKAAIGPNSRKATGKVVSEDEDLVAPIEALDYLEVSCSKGSLLKDVLTLFHFKTNIKKMETSSSILNVLSGFMAFGP